MTAALKALATGPHWALPDLQSDVNYLGNTDSIEFLLAAHRFLLRDLDTDAGTLKTFGDKLIAEAPRWLTERPSDLERIAFAPVVDIVASEGAQDWSRKHAPRRRWLRICSPIHATAG